MKIINGGISFSAESKDEGVQYISNIIQRNRSTREHLVRISQNPGPLATTYFTPRKSVMHK